MLYAVMFRSTASERDSIHALRAILKHAKRRGLLAVDMRELPSTNNQTIRRRDARRRTVNLTQRRNEVIMSINLRKYGPANKWLKLEDLHGKPPLRERIGDVKVEDGKFGERVVLAFEPSVLEPDRHQLEGAHRDEAGAAGVAQQRRPCDGRREFNEESRVSCKTSPTRSRAMPRRRFASRRPR